MALETRSQRPVAIAGARVCGQGDRRNVGVQTAKLCEERVPVFDGQSQVGYHQVRPFSPGMATLESSILTNTLVASKNGGNSTSTASGSVIVTPKVYWCPNNDCSGGSGALVDITKIGGTVTPNQVTFNQRTQTLSASLQGLNCTIDATTGVLTCTDPETIGLLLSTMSANGFNFLVQTPGQGVYQVQLGIALEAAATTNALPAGAQATVGVGAGSLVEMIVQAQTPFDTIKLCAGGPSTGNGGPTNCGPQ